jgi:hypothetical protein
MFVGLEPGSGAFALLARSFLGSINLLAGLPVESIPADTVRTLPA